MPMRRPACTPSGPARRGLRCRVASRVASTRRLAVLLAIWGLLGGPSVAVAGEPPSATSIAPAETPAAAGIRPSPDQEPPSGRQHLVRDPSQLARLLEQALAGDEFILWPGEYPSITLRDLAGRRDAPITIRGLRQESPPRIVGGSWGIRLLGVSHVKLHDLEVIAPRIDGIEIAPGDDGRRSSDVELRNIQITDVGDRPGRHGVLVRGADSIVLDRVTVKGWTGAGIEVVGTRGIELTGVRLEGAGRGEMLGLRLRAGTRDAVVSLSRIRDPGVGGIVLGGRSQDAEFPPDHRADRDGVRWEVESVDLQDITIVGGDVTLTFLGVTRLTATHLTAITPARAAIRIGRPRDGMLFGHLDTAMLSRCLFVWMGDAEPVPVEFGPGGDDAGLWLEENLWWRSSSPLSPETRFPGEAAGPQRIDVDPRLGPDLRPRNPEAEGFGHRPTVTWVPDAPFRGGSRFR